MPEGPMGEYDARRARTEARAQALNRAREQATYLDSRLKDLDEQSVQQRPNLAINPETAIGDALEKGLLEVAAAVNRLTVVVGSRD